MCLANIVKTVLVFWSASQVEEVQVLEVSEEYW